MTDPNVEDHFTVFVRLPFKRGDFVDPPPVAWSSAKERALWDILSRSSKSNDIDWKTLAERFEVTQPFLLQKASWLYERQLEQVRAQMRRVGSRPSATPSPVPGSATASVVGSQPMRRNGSGGSRVPSRLSTQQPLGSPNLSGGDNSTPGTPAKSRTSLPFRTPAANLTATQSRTASGTTRQISRQSSKDIDLPGPPSQSRRGSIQHQLSRSPRQAVSLQPHSSSSDDEMTQSRAATRRVNPSSLHRRALSYRKEAQPGKAPVVTSENKQPARDIEDEDEDEDEPSFLPFANPTNETKPRITAFSQQDPGATLRDEVQGGRPGMHRRSTSERIPKEIVPSPTVEPPTPVQDRHGRRDLESSTSSLSSPAQTDPPAITTRSTAHQQSAPRLTTPLSPSQRAILQNQAGSPRRTPQGPGSDSASPSMGSSFSDLDDASVTQSALEEALLSGMGNTTMTNLGGFGGRVTSGIGQALRSRYFDARGEAQSRGTTQHPGGVSER
jgi:hypothetical protein